MNHVLDRVWRVAGWLSVAWWFWFTIDSARRGYYGLLYVMGATFVGLLAYAWWVRRTDQRG
jgi:hypothetical protein